MIQFFRASQRLAAVAGELLLHLIKTVRTAAVAVAELAIAWQVLAVQPLVGKATTEEQRQRRQMALQAAVELGQLARIVLEIMALMVELARRHLSPDHLLRAAVVAEAVEIRLPIVEATVALAVVVMERAAVMRPRGQSTQVVVAVAVMVQLGPLAMAQMADRVLLF